jgi:alpha-glucosidase
MDFTFVNVNGFTPNTRVNWVPVGKVASWTRTGEKLRLDLATPSMALEISFLGPECFRVRFRPVTNPDYSVETSAAVVERDLDLSPAALAVTADATRITADTGAITVLIDLDPYRIQVLRGGHLISADDPTFNLVYVPKSVDPSAEVIAIFKVYPANARYCGFGSKAGAQLFKNQFTMTFFNFDNFKYEKGFIPGGQGGPLNPAEPLYCSVPLLLEVNPQPVGDFAGPPYAYGIFIDNPSQSFINIGASDYSNMFGLYYFGALYGEMDYYFMAGAEAGDVLTQYTTLTGRAPMPPRYALGYHQGAYGYFDHVRLTAAANAYRAARFPIDGLHIDVDFQDNYRTFTHSEKKFPNVRTYFDGLHAGGFKCSTNITPMLNRTDLDENANMVPYPERDALRAAGALLEQRFDGDPPPVESPVLYVGNVNYGNNNGINPFPVFPPPAQPGQLGASGHYSDYSRAAVRQLWGDQYRHLIQDVGLDMIWQDMTCPAIDPGGAGSFRNPFSFPLDLIQQPDGLGPVAHARIHNQYVLQLLQATWEGIQLLRKAVGNRRNFIIARGGYAGMQRYAGLWTGDSPSSWEYFSILVPQVLNLGLSGIPISGADVGGFAKGSASSDNSFFAGKVFGGITDPELLTRWMHLGAFLPWYRNHYNGYEKEFQEPYAYGEPVLSNCRKYVELRYRLLQVFYDAMFEWTRTGMPICRALFLNDPNDLAAYDWVDSEFFVGRDLLVAPILTRGNSNRNVYLPTGSDWYSFKDNRAKLEPPVPGGSRFSYFAPLDLVPLYVRAGAILPMRELEQYVGELPQNPITINVYPGPDRSYTLYQDDGISFDAQDLQQFRITELSHRGIAGGQEMRVRRTFDRYEPPEPFYFVAFPGTRHPTSVTLGAAGLPDVGSPENLAGSHADAYYWNASIEVTFVKVFDTDTDVTLTVLF